MSYDPKQVVFVDTETTGLDPERHEVWEVAIITEHTEWQWFLDVDEAKADLIALGIGGYHDRHPSGNAYTGERKLGARDPNGMATVIARLLHGRHIVGAVPDFDARFLTKLLTRAGRLPSWHYHLIDVEALMVGYLNAAVDAHLLAAERKLTTYPPPFDRPSLPWKSRDLSRAVGVDPEAFEQHTALGDARWAKACFEAVMGQPEIPEVTS